MLVAELDLKLLLAIHYACGKAYIAVPWDDIAREMGPGTTGSDILDYLATTRTQMVARGLDVPPPPSPPSKIKEANRKILYWSNKSDDNDEAWDVDDSDTESGDPIAKRAKMSTKASSTRKVYDDTGDGEYVNAEVVITGQRRLDLADDYASHPKTDPRTLYQKRLIFPPTSTKKDVHEAVFHNGKVVDTVKGGSEHHHMKDADVQVDHAKDHQTKGLNVPPPPNFPGKMKIGFVVSPTPTKKDAHGAVFHDCKMVDTVKSGSQHHHVKDDHVKNDDVQFDHMKDHQVKGLDVAPPPSFPGKMKIGFVVSPTPTKKDIHETVVQKRHVLAYGNNFSGAQVWNMGNPIPYSYQSGLHERFQRLHESYPDPGTISAGRDDTTGYNDNWQRDLPQSGVAGCASSAENENRNLNQWGRDFVDSLRY